MTRCQDVGFGGAHMVHFWDLSQAAPGREPARMIDTGLERLRAMRRVTAQGSSSGG